MVSSSDDLAPVMSLSIAPTPADGSTSTRSVPDPPVEAPGDVAAACDAFGFGFDSDLDVESVFAFAVGPALTDKALHPAKTITNSKPEATIANKRRMSPIRLIAIEMPHTRQSLCR
jgi:hypothetical protein